MKLVKLFDDLEIFSAKNLDHEGELAKVYHLEGSNLFLETSLTSGLTKLYKLKGDFKEIAKKHRHEILTYCLGKNYPMQETVSLRDLYLWQGEQFELVSDSEEMDRLDKVFGQLHPNVPRGVD